MSFRAVILGLLGAGLIAGIGYVHRYIGGLTHLTRGHFPIAVFGALFIVVVGINPLLGRIRANLRLRPGELAIALALTLVGCNVADAGLMRHFTQAVALPSVDYAARPHWRNAYLMSYVPPAILLAGGNADDPALTELQLGRQSGADLPGLEIVPWGPWGKLLTYWVPMILMFAMISISLAMIVHRNWCSRERLRYPIAAFATMLISQDSEQRGSIFRDKIFWIGFLVLLGIRIINGLHMWFPRQMIEIPLTFNFSALYQGFPGFMRTPQSWYLAKPVLYPTAVALAFLLASDISFSLGISNLFSVTVMYFMLRFGVRMSSETAIGGVNEWVSFGAFVGFALMVIYIGRREYWRVFKGGLAFRTPEGADPSAVRAARVFIICSAGMVAMLCTGGLSFPVAIVLLLVVVMMHFIMARMSAECGVFFFLPAWSVLGAMIGLIGIESLGPGSMVIIGIFVAAFTQAPWECLMPYVTNGLKMTQDARVSPGRVGVGAGLAFAIALGVVLPVALWCGYYFGQSDSVVRSWWDEAARSVTKLNNLGRLESVNAQSGWDRIANIRPDREFAWAFGIGFALVIACSALRLRFRWWFIHPVLLLVFAAWSIGKYSYSFLLGCIMKVAVTTFGGSKVYRRSIRLVAGVIAGDVLGGSIFMLVNVLYYAATGLRGMEYVKSYIL